MGRRNIFLILFVILILASFTATTSCKACKKQGEAEPEVSITSGPLSLPAPAAPPQTKTVAAAGPKIRRIDIGRSGRTIEEEPAPGADTGDQAASTDKDLPPNTTQEDDLTERLKSKLLDAYGGKEEDLPDVKIYTSEMTYPEFVDYYEKLGYHVTKVQVPAVDIIAPVLEQRQELAGRVNMADYENVFINQVVVDGIGISAADKYIDPDTFAVVSKTFVTKVNKEE